MRHRQRRGSKEKWSKLSSGWIIQQECMYQERDPLRSEEPGPPVRSPSAERRTDSPGRIMLWEVTEKRKGVNLLAI